MFISIVRFILGFKTYAHVHTFLSISFKKAKCYKIAYTSNFYDYGIGNGFSLRSAYTLMFGSYVFCHVCYRYGGDLRLTSDETGSKQSKQANRSKGGRKTPLSPVNRQGIQKWQSIYFNKILKMKNTMKTLKK